MDDVRGKGIAPPLGITTRKNKFYLFISSWTLFKKFFTPKENNANMW
jgi:hypothetical protein